jgi:hypothetical protein
MSKNWMEDGLWRTVIRSGNDPACTHARHAPSDTDGYGSTCFFSTCRCGAKISTSTGNDPYLSALESERDGP